ncbi:MAG TPA: tetratricopeptide repeat protein [Bryobacteraceae bacterium]|nr:tetratricopeptide repeat protein [Bryobacteraceae bacterium]
MVRYSRRILASTLISLALAVAPAVAQSTGAGATGVEREQGNASRMNSNPTELIRPIVLSGKVMLEDGTVPPDAVILELDCGGGARPQGHTDAKGRFSVTIGQDQTETLDASYGNIGEPVSNAVASYNRAVPTSPSLGSPVGQSSSERDLMNCELRAVLGGFSPASVKLSGPRALEYTDVGTMILHRLADVSGFTYSVTSADAPKDARKAFEKGLELRRKNRGADAEVQFKKATAVYPRFAAAYYELGRTQTAANKNEEARKNFTAALNVDPRYVSPALELAMLSFRESTWQDAAAYGDRVTKLDPYSYPIAYYVAGMAYLQMTQPAAAEKNARELVKLDPGHKYPEGVYVLALALAQQKKYPEALQQMRSYLQLAPDGPEAPTVKRHIQRLMQLTGELPTTTGTPSATRKQ